MAVPSISSVDPAEGYTRGGNLISVVGTNFRLPDPPPPGNVTGDQDRTVKVEFEGVESEWAYAASASLIYARVPEWRGEYDIIPAALDVRVANLDNSGVEIAGENNTLADAYTIDRPKFSSESYFQRVCREVIKLFRRHVIENTHMAVRRDYPASPDYLALLKASAPVIHLIGPSVPKNRFDTINREDTEEDPSDPDAWFRVKYPTTVNVIFDIRAFASASPNDAVTMTIMSMYTAMINMFRDIPFLRMDINPSDPSKGYYEYEFKIPWTNYPDLNLGVNEHDLVEFSGQCEIVGVQIDDEDKTIIERGWNVTANDGEPTVEVAEA